MLRRWKKTDMATDVDVVVDVGDVARDVVELFGVDTEVDFSGVASDVDRFAVATGVHIATVHL